MELEVSLDMITTYLEAEEEDTISNLDWVGTREVQTFRWFQEPENWDDLCIARGEANKEDMAEKHAKLYSIFVRLEKLKNLGAKKKNKKKEHSTRGKPCKTLAQRF